MIVVLDSGVWVSAFRFGGTPKVALDVVFRRHTVAICNQIVTEVRGTLRRKFGWEEYETSELFRGYLRKAIQIHVTGAVHGVCRDSKDDMILECAWKAKAGVIISGDKDLLSVGSFRGIPVLTPRQFLDQFS